MADNNPAGYADVYVRFPIDSHFTYRIPEDMHVEPGIRVIVNFGNRETTAFVFRTHNIRPLEYQVKDIIRVIDDSPVFGQGLVELAGYTSENYICSMGEVMSLALPGAVSRTHRTAEPFTSGEKTQGGINLTSEQNAVYKSIMDSFGRGELFHLIFGITGSGKTEIYIEAAREAIRRGRSVLFLVPEISLSSQIFERLYNVFGSGLVLYHSGLSPNQRFDNWMKFYSGQCKAAVGTRSAIFMQCPDLGLIIVDEEHDGSYKEGGTPRYNSRRLALFRSKREKALLIMGSATPAVESLYAAERGVFRLHNLYNRYGDARLPDIEIVPIKPHKPEDMLSPVLRLHSKKAIESGNQVVLLLNRRGFSPIYICQDCGEPVLCPSCCISLNYHNDDLLHCHYCGYRVRSPRTCKNCGSEEYLKLGSGTQRLEELIKTAFKNPGSELRVFRLDQDTSRKRGMAFDFIEKMKSGEIDILLGTQMVAKGFDFQNVSIVGIVMADIGMNLPDYRSSERIFALLMQVAGRCGRGSVPGRVIVQTLSGEHQMFGFLKRHDYYGFYKKELTIRKMLDYPPFSRIARLLVRGKNEEMVKEKINALKELLDREIMDPGHNISILGPVETAIPKISKNYRYHIILKSRDINGMIKVIGNVKKNIEWKNTYLEIDMDPYDML